LFQLLPCEAGSVGIGEIANQALQRGACLAIALEFDAGQADLEQRFRNLGAGAELVDQILEAAQRRRIFTLEEIRLARLLLKK